MPIPCPSCQQPLDLTLDFIIQNPVCTCPHCEVVMNFKPNEDVVKQYNKALSDIDDIKKKYSNMAKFNSKNVL